MGKHFRCVTDICGNDMQYLELHKKHSNMDGAVKATGINTIVKRRKQLIQ